MSPNNRERHIEERIVACPERLGYPGALAVREFRFGDIGDKKCIPDVLLLPTVGVHRLVIIEAKHVDNPEADGAVVAQLCGYHESAQARLGSHGLELLQIFACDHSERALDKDTIRANELCDESCQEEALKKIETGPKLKPEEIGLFVALAGGNPSDSLNRELDRESVKEGKNPGRNIGVVILEEDRPRVIRKIVVVNRITEK